MEKKEYLQQAGGVLSGVFDVLTIVAKVVLYVLGFALFMFGIVGIAGVISTVFFDEIFFISNDIRGFITPKEFFAMFSVSGELNRFIFSLGSFLLIVFLMIAYTGSKLLFRFKSNSKLFFITGISLLVLASAFTGINSALIFSKYDKEDGFITNEPVAYNSGDTLTLTLSTSFDKAYKTADIDWDKFRIDTENGKLIQIYGIPQLDIIKNEEDSVVLSSEYKIRGLAEGRQAKKSLYQYEWKQKGGELIFNPYFTTAEQTKFHFENLDLILKIPAGAYIYLDSDIEDLIWDIDNVENVWDHDMIDKYWYMSEDGLVESE